MSECNLEITQQEFDAIAKCESVVVREYERADGTHYAEAVAWVDSEEMQDAASTRGLFVVPVGVSIVCQTAIPVSELLGPDDDG